MVQAGNVKDENWKEKGNRFTSQNRNWRDLGGEWKWKETHLAFPDECVWLDTMHKRDARIQTPHSFLGASEMDWQWERVTFWRSSTRFLVLSGDLIWFVGVDCTLLGRWEQGKEKNHSPSHERYKRGLKFLWH